MLDWGATMEREVAGRVEAVLIGREPGLRTLKEKHASPGAAYLITEQVPEVRVTLEGFEGDRHAGMTRRSDGRTPFYPRGIAIRNARQVSLVSAEELAELAAALGIPAVMPEWLGANLVLSGVPRLSCVPPASRLFFPGEATLVVSDENHPCVFPGKAIQERNPDVPDIVATFPKAAYHRRGVVTWVERAGAIRAGDTVRVKIAEQVLYRVP